MLIRNIFLTLNDLVRDSFLQSGKFDLMSGLTEMRPPKSLPKHCCIGEGARGSKATDNFGGLKIMNSREKASVLS